LQHVLAIWSFVFA